MKYTTKTVKEIEYHEIDALITSVYGQPYEIIADMEWNNDESHDYEVKKEELNSWEINDLKRFKEEGTSLYLLSTLLTDLCNNGHLEEGNYLITVSW